MYRVLVVFVLVLFAVPLAAQEGVELAPSFDPSLFASPLASPVGPADEPMLTATHAPVGVECEPDVGPCVGNLDRICLHDDRFKVTVEFTRPGGEPQPAQHLSWSDQSGLVTFFDFLNLEMIVKVLNACVEPFNRYWVFFSATTNVEFDVRVTDLEANVARCYHNPQGMTAMPVQDTGAFDTCP